MPATYDVIPIGADGSASQNADGALIIGDSSAETLSCCCCETVACEHCEAGLPRYWALTATGVDYDECTACTEFNTLYAKWTLTTFLDPNNTYTLTAEIASCTAEAPDTGDVGTSYLFDDSGCTSPVGIGSLPITGLAWRLVRTSTTWQMFGLLQGGFPGTPALVFFYDEIAATDCNPESLEFTNECVGDCTIKSFGVLGNQQDIGSGGTVIVTPCAPAP